MKNMMIISNTEEGVQFNIELNKGTIDLEFIDNPMPMEKIIFNGKTPIIVTYPYDVTMLAPIARELDMVDGMIAIAQTFQQNFNFDKNGKLTMPMAMESELNSGKSLEIPLVGDFQEEEIQPAYDEEILSHKLSAEILSLYTGKKYNAWHIKQMLKTEKYLSIEDILSLSKKLLGKKWEERKKDIINTCLYVHQKILNKELD